MCKDELESIHKVFIKYVVEQWRNQTFSFGGAEGGGAKG